MAGYQSEVLGRAISADANNLLTFGTDGLLYAGAAAPGTPPVIDRRAAILERHLPNISKDPGNQLAKGTDRKLLALAGGAVAPLARKRGYVEEIHLRMISRQAGNKLTVGSDGMLFVSGVSVMPFSAELPLAPALAPPPAAPAAAPPVVYTRTELEAMLKSDLETIAAERSVPVFGTGAGGTVLKSDLVDAILADQAGG